MERPEGAQPFYGEHLGDVAYWDPYVREVLDRHDLDDAPIESGYVGTFPTFLAGDVVVKLFGPLFDGPNAFEVECAAHEAIADVAAIPAPEIVGTGALFATDDAWPYLIQERVGGVAIRDAALDRDERCRIAAQLASAVLAVHALPVPTFRTDLLAHLRLRPNPWLTSTLTAHQQAYLADALPATTFVHGDITADHLFVDGGRLVAIIDWGDALPADPYYELVPILFDAFGRDRPIGEAFLDAYGFDRDADFERRLTQAALEFQFNAFYGVAIDDVERIDDLAARLWP